MIAPRVRIPAATWDVLRRHHLPPRSRAERISYLFGRAVRSARGVEAMVFGDPPILPADDCYLSHGPGHVALDPQVQAAIFAQFARSGCDVVANIHDHHFARSGTRFSSTDTADDLALARYCLGTLEPLLASDPAFGPARQVTSLSLVLDQQGLDARFADRRGHLRQVETVDIIGAQARRIRCNGAHAAAAGASPTLLRQKDFITPDQADMISSLRFGVLGCGGLGSIAGEALVRLGARTLVLFDDDKLEPHNLNRWQGGRDRDVGRGKAGLLAARLRAMAPAGEVQATAVPRSIMDPAAMPALKRCDVLVGCLDNHMARAFANRFSLQYLIPLFDAGVNIRTADGVDFEDRVYTVIPGETACAECTAYELLDPKVVQVALMADITIEERRRAGYADDIPELTGSASAYALNMRAVSAMLLELQNWISGYRPLATCVAEGWRQGRHQRSDRENHPEGPDPECVVCSLLGAGDDIELPRPPPPGRARSLLLEASARLALAAPSQHP